MMTNTYLPHVGGVARSVESFTHAFRTMGHGVLVVAPTFERMPEHETGVVRVPAIQNFNGSDFSVRLPLAGDLPYELDRFDPDLIHSHHPFLLGDTAMRAATSRGLPLIFTHHTMYEQYTHYVPGNSPTLRRFVIRLATEYANLCDHVIAPSQSVADVLTQRGVRTPITPIPTGIDPSRFTDGDGPAARQRIGIPADAFVVGHVGRLAPEKNLPFLAEAVAAFLAQKETAHCLIVGEGPSRDVIEQTFERAGARDRLHLTGKLTGSDLADAYHAMDVFAFASQSETQGMVLAEAMTVGVPVVAVDAPGVREVVEDGRNGRLLLDEDAEAFTAALVDVADRDEPGRRTMIEAALKTAERFTLKRCASRTLEVYGDLLERRRKARSIEDNPWAQTLRVLEKEWNLWSTRAEAVLESALPEES